MMSQFAAMRTTALAILSLVLLIADCGGTTVTPGTLAPIDGSAGVVDASAEAGRLDARAVDATVDAMGCRGLCPGGCCDTSGQCQTGNTAADCGKSGQSCQNCSAAGFQACDATRRTCYNTVAQCGPTNCKGCCVQNLCFGGTDANDCGSGGQACQSCAANGLVCAGQQCAVSSCGPSNCAGCCIGTQCLSGADQAACGQHGGQCADCATSGASCVSDGGVGGQCGQGNCSFATCVSGCCDSNGICQTGSSAAACGGRGTSCQTCAAGTECLGQSCVCDARSCPTGCCTFRGQGSSCQAGTSDFQCGNRAQLCQNCVSLGNIHCTNQQCPIPPPPPPCQCAGGCCDLQGVCQPGASNAQCGLPGGACQDCTQSGAVCQFQQCAALGVDAGPCNAQSCPSGCCDSNGQCQQGVTTLACGNFGTNCQNCLEASGQCGANQQCTVPSEAGPGCNGGNCNGCCDAQGNCANGFAGTQCGTSGQRCVDCVALGDQCQSGSCTSPDGGTLCSQSCAGCCDAQGNCRGGFTNTQCGELGGACANCSGLSPPSTCDVVVSPRACTSQQMQCPGPYPRCPASLMQPAPTRQNVCSTADLQNATGACAGGAHTSACAAFMNFVSIPCANCLQGFQFDFAEQAGVRLCVAPFVDAPCNHNSACIVDCTTQSCFNCPDAPSTLQCDGQVASAPCSALYQADQCVAAALGGPAAVCNPSTYQGNFGAWLQAVGAKYCGP